MDKKFKKIKDSSPKNQCYCFAFGVPNEELEYIFSVFHFIYFPVLKNPQVGDIVLFSKLPNSNISHSAVIYKPNDNLQDIICHCTFLGQSGIFEMKLSDTPVEFGRICKIYRRK